MWSNTFCKVAKLYDFIFKDRPNVFVCNSLIYFCKSMHNINCTDTYVHTMNHLLAFMRKCFVFSKSNTQYLYSRCNIIYTLPFKGYRWLQTLQMDWPINTIFKRMWLGVRAWTWANIWCANRQGKAASPLKFFKYPHVVRVFLQKLNSNATKMVMANVNVIGNVRIGNSKRKNKGNTNIYVYLLHLPHTKKSPIWSTGLHTYICILTRPFSKLKSTQTYGHMVRRYDTLYYIQKRESCGALTIVVLARRCH